MLAIARRHIAAAGLSDRVAMRAPGADKTAPRFAALFSLNMLVGTAAGASYSEDEYAAWLREAGFTDIRRIPVPGPAAIMTAVRG